MIYCIGDSHASFFGGIDKMQPIWPEKSNNILQISFNASAKANLIKIKQEKDIYPIFFSTTLKI